MNKTFEAGNVIDQHRIAHANLSADGYTIVCACGLESISLYKDFLDTLLTSERNPERAAQRAHANHVAQKVAEHQEDPRRAVLEQAREEIGHKKPELKTVQRSTATKYQVTQFDRECLNLVTADLLRRAAMEIGRHEEIPTQIMIDRAPITGGEKITLTWFA